MNGFAATVRSKPASSCVVDGVDNIDKGNCGASLADAPHPRVIVDLDETGSPLGGAQTKCDFLLFADPDLVTTIEVKDHDSPDIGKAKKQHQAGAKAAEALAPTNPAITFRPVLVSRTLRRPKQHELRQVTVTFRKRRERVRSLACGEPLTVALDDS